MNGREHLFWGFMSFSITIFAFTVGFDYRDVGFYTYSAMFLLILFSCLFNELGNIPESRLKKINQARNKEERVSKITLSSKENKIVSIFRTISYSFLMLLVILSTYVAIPSSDNPIFIILGYLGAYAGSDLPDIDKKFGGGDMRYHRDPLTHSSFIVFALGIACFIALPDIFASAILGIIGLIIGNTIHLLCDNFESEGSLIDILINRMHCKECPGDIRKIREDRERLWLNTHVFFGIIVVLLLFARFDYPDFPWVNDFVIASFDIMTWQTTYIMTIPSYFMILVMAIYYACWLILFIAWHDKKAIKKTLKASSNNKKKKVTQ